MRASFLTERKETFAAGIDVRVKLLLCFCGSVVSIALSSPLSLGFLAGCSMLLALGAARPLTIAKMYLFAVLMLAFALAFSGLISLAVPGLMHWNAFSLSVPFLRILISVNLLLMLALSTPVQTLFNRLQSWKLPVWVHVPLSVAIRFVPSFINDCAQIRDAARLRPGAGLRRFWRGFAVPLVFRMLYSADDLAMAAELKGVGSAAKTRLSQKECMTRRDAAVAACTALALSAAVLMQYYGPQFRPQPM